MSFRLEIPFLPRPNEPSSTRMAPPWVPVEPRWEYKELVRNLEDEDLPTEAELDALGTDHWELAGIVQQERRVHFYFKRERAR
jgi:hypothetical protein